MIIKLNKTGKISLSYNFLKDSFLILKNRGLKQIFLGNKVSLNDKERELLDWIKRSPKEFRDLGGRQGSLIKKDIVHKGEGNVYLFADKNNWSKSILLFDDGVRIRSGPDLYVYLSTNRDVRRGLGKIINLGLLKGTRGGQSYIINKNIKMLGKYNSAVIYCKQFSELFTFAELK